MPKASMEEIEKAFKEYEEAAADLHRLLDRHLPQRVMPGDPVPPQEEVTDEVLKEVEEAEAKVNQTLNKWTDLMGL